MISVFTAFIQQVQKNCSSIAIEEANGHQVSYASLLQQVCNFSLILQERGVKLQDKVCIILPSSLKFVVSVLSCLQIGAVYVHIDPEMPVEYQQHVISVCNPKLIISTRCDIVDISIMLGMEADSRILYTEDEVKIPLNETYVIDTSLERNAVLELHSNTDIKTLERSSNVVSAKRKPLDARIHFSEYEDVSFETLDMIMGCHELLIKGKNVDAYIIFTSGSTGNPNGVVIKTNGITKLGRYCGSMYGITEGVRVLQYANISFDACVFEMYNTLLNSGTLVLSTRNQMLPGTPLYETITTRDINVIHIPPSSLMGMVAYKNMLPSLRSIICCGEKLMPIVVETWSIPESQSVLENISDELCISNEGRTVFNAYGPTECTVCTHTHKCDPDIDTEYVPIGKPLPWFDVYTEDVNMNIDTECRNMNMNIDTECKEMFIGGSTVSSGYLDNDQLTNERFIKGYFKTKDSVMINENGEYIYLGRLDNMVKYRGYRIELEAIESHIASHSYVKEACVVLNTTEDRKELIAFIICYTEDVTEVDTVTIKDYLSTRIPDYMIPGVIVSVKEFPLMSNRSKIDRKGLLSKYLSERNAKEDNVIEDSTPFMYIKSLLEKKLGFEINMNDTLITAGGSSIDAVYLVNELNDKYNFVTERIPVSVVYESKVTLQRLSEYVQVRLDTGTFGCSEYNYELEAKLPDDIGSGIIKLVQCGRDKAQSALSHESTSKMENISSHESVESTLCTPSTVLVTGSTGFLGRQFVIELAKQNVNIILLIRGREPRERFIRLASQFKSFDVACMDKIKIVNGDLLQDNFGLSHREYYTLAEQVDIVVHSAADISYIKVYEALREANVIGTQRIIKFCSDTKLKYLHYVSSMGIFGPVGATRGWSDLSETRDYKENLKFLHLENGYIQSKWVAEGIVRDAKACGLNVKIYRPGFVESPLDGSLSNTSDFLCRYLKGCLDLGCYPNLPRKYWLITPVDFIAKVMTMSIMLSIEGIANNVYEDTSVDGDITQLDLFHLTPESRDEFSNNELFEALIGYGYKLDCVPYHQWLLKVQGIMRDRDIEHPLYGVGSYITEKIYGGRHTILAMHHYTPPLVTTNLKEFIKCMNGRFDIDIEPIVWNEETFRGYIQHYIDQGWFPSV